jgi:hypothetical protein
MSLKSFKSVGWVAGIAATALGCYMVNLKVATERASLEEVENRIVMAQRDIRVLQTEIGTRGRLAQLEQWNVKVLALSAPKANQFLEGSFQLATLSAPNKTMDPQAPVVLASAPAPAQTAPAVDTDGAAAEPSPTPAPTVAVAPAPKPSSPADMMHVAGLRREVSQPAMAARKQKSVEKPAALPAPTATSAKAPATKTAAAKTADSSARPKPKTAVTGAAKQTTATAKPTTTAKAKAKAREVATER